MNSIGKDLATIRLHLNLTLDEIHQTTRIPLETLKRIENSAIFRDKDENVVYIRSFVRTYAKALKISDEQVLKALDEHKSGTYDRDLLNAYPDIKKLAQPPHPLLDEEDESFSKDASGSRHSKEKDDRPAGGTGEGGTKSVQNTGAETAQGTGTAQESGTDSASGTAHKPGGKKAPVKPEKNLGGHAESSGTGNTGGLPEGAPPVSGQSPQTASEPGESRQNKEKGHASDADDSVHSSDPSADKSGGTAQESGSDSASGPAGDTASDEKSGPQKKFNKVDWSKVGRQQKKFQKKTPVWLIGTVVIVVILVCSAYLIYGSNIFDEEPSVPESEEFEAGAGTETENSGLSLDLAGNSSSDPSNEAVQSSLDETLYITVYAANNRLDPVRVWSDLKPRIDPYWIEHGQAVNFEFRDTIRINGQYSQMLLFLNGHRIDNFRQEFYHQEENAVELTRDQFSGGDWADPVPLELPEEIAEPDSVQPRPTFF